jgi:hypothetical protein
MPKLASLKQSYKEWSEPSKPDSDEYYPSLYLDEKTLDAMGLETARVGAEMTMVSTIRVSSVSDTKGGQRSMSFELLEAAISPKQEEKDAASILFPHG